MFAVNKGGSVRGDRVQQAVYTHRDAEATVKRNAHVFQTKQLPFTLPILLRLLGR